LIGLIPDLEKQSMVDGLSKKNYKDQLGVTSGRSG